MHTPHSQTNLDPIYKYGRDEWNNQNKVLDYLLSLNKQIIAMSRHTICINSKQVKSTLWL